MIQIYDFSKFQEPPNFLLAVSMEAPSQLKHTKTSLGQQQSESKVWASRDNARQLQTGGMSRSCPQTPLLRLCPNRCNWDAATRIEQWTFQLDVRCLINQDTRRIITCKAKLSNVTEQQYQFLHLLISNQQINFSFFWISPFFTDFLCQRGGLGLV